MTGVLALHLKLNPAGVTTGAGLVKFDAAGKELDGVDFTPAALAAAGAGPEDILAGLRYLIALWRDEDTVLAVDLGYPTRPDVLAALPQVGFAAHSYVTGPAYFVEISTLLYVAGYQPPRVADYIRMHGLTVPGGEQPGHPMHDARAAGIAACQILNHPARFTNTRRMALDLRGWLLDAGYPESGVTVRALACEVLLRCDPDPDPAAGVQRARKFVESLRMTWSTRWCCVIDPATAAVDLAAGRPILITDRNWNR